MRTAIMLATGLLTCAMSGPTSAEQPASVPGASSAPITVSPQRQLDQLDSRRPVPMPPQMALHQKKNMQDHLKAVQEIVAGLAADDFAAVERSAGRMGYTEQMGSMCRMMGAQAPGFTELALNFHHTADTIGEAAKHKDRAGVLKALNATLTTCVTCHSTFRQQIVEGEASMHGGMGSMGGMLETSGAGSSAGH